MPKSGVIILKQGREKSALNFHPWIFSGAIDTKRTNQHEIENGALVEVRDYQGQFVGRGIFNIDSAIRVRLLSWDQNEAIGPAWWRVRLAQAIAARQTLAERDDLSTYRLVNAESDGLPGLIVDRYGDFLVVQFLTLGVEVRKEMIIEALSDLIKPLGIYERSDVDVRQKEGLDESVGLLWGDPLPERVEIVEYGVRYPVDILQGHKTGFYLDQRDSRHWLLTSPLVGGRDVLNCFAFTGGFGVCAALNGAASVVNVDSSQPALDIARETMSINGLESGDATYVNADVFAQLREYREAEREFDLIILDPPKFAHSAKQVEKASRGYKDINMLAFQLLRPGGLLATFSCSGQVSPDLFQKIVFGASADAGVQAQIIKWLAQPEDHPVLLSFPEGRYLKGLICRVMR
ncbi:MAG: class I SAM-dependent rRNA methyltransferase [Anaerolineae bacterium]|nr:class I SAM-dependent rRNA methyltransferase [Anaerolineae bacterium]